jgi:hypothetical protein
MIPVTLLATLICPLIPIRLGSLTSALNYTQNGLKATSKATQTTPDCTQKCTSRVADTVDGELKAHKGMSAEWYPHTFTIPKPFHLTDDLITN